MANETDIMRVNKKFSRYVSEVKRDLEKDGIDVSTSDLTGIFAAFRPQIRIDKEKKRNPVFDW